MANKQYNVGSQQTPGSAGGSGTVTSVSGTTNQIDVATGTTTPVISLDATALLADIPYGGTTAGSATVQTLTVPNIPATPTAGTKISFLSGFASTGATTLNVTPTGGSAWGALNLMKRTTAGVAALGASGDLAANSPYVAIYDGTEWVVQTTSSTVYTAGALTTAGLIYGNGNNQVAGQANLTLDGTHAFFAKINNETLAGFGVSFVRGVTSQAAETTTPATVLTVTPASAVGSYRVTYNASVSAATSGVIGFTLSWTDSNAAAQSNIALPLYQQGVAAPALTFTTSAAGNYSGQFTFDTNAAGAAITLKWVGGGTTTAKVSGNVQRLQ